jgi:hypothetical protein
MNSQVPQIGFDRFVRLEWITAAIDVRAGSATVDELTQTLVTAGLAKEVRAKTRTKLNALILNPRPDLVDFVDRGIAQLKAQGGMPLSTMAWGLAIATYPFFGKVAEITGRLTSIQGDCSASEIHRRIGELYGDRQATKRATQFILQTQAAWGAIDRVEKGRRLIRRTPTTLNNLAVVEWVIEAVLRYTGKAIAVPTLQSMAVIYPFVLDQPLAYLASTSSTLELRSNGPRDQDVGLRSELAINSPA